MDIVKNCKLAILFFLFGITLAIYWVGLTGEFYFDDEWNILSNSALKINDLSLSSLAHASNSGSSGPLGRPLAMVSFAINHYFSNFSPFVFKLTNLIIHLLCGTGVFVLALGLARQVASLNKRQCEQLALLVTAFWLFHPLNLTPVLYVVQRMTGLSALFCFWGLACYVFGRRRLLAGKPIGFPLIIAGFAVFFPLGMFSKENAALFPLYCFLIEIVFFRFKTLEARSKFLLIALFVTTLALPSFLIATYSVIKPEWLLSGYAVRDFSLLERLLTESRVLVFYLKQILLPVNGELGLFHDDIGLSDSLISPITTLLSIVLISCLIGSALIYLKKFTVYSFGVLFFFAAHLMESTIISLELVHEHRNYVASFSILFVIAYWLIISIKDNSLIRVKCGVVFIALFYLGFSTFLRASVWGNPGLHPFEELRNHPDSPRVNYHVGKIFASHGHDQDDAKRRRVYLEKASLHFVKSAELSDSYTDGLFGLLLLQGIEGITMGDKYYQLLLNRLASGPFNANNYNYLAAYFKCINAAVCKVDTFEVDNLIAACKKNAHFGGVHANNILKLYSRYKSQVVF